MAVLLAQAPAAPAAPSAKTIARGKYLATIGACNDCHSPKIDPQQHPDPKRPFSGRPQTTMAPSQNNGEIHASLDLTAWAGPWGVSYGANLTPDPETGLKKRYTEASFIKTLRTGKKPEGEDLLPPMPWELYKVHAGRGPQGPLRVSSDDSRDQEQREERGATRETGRRSGKK